MDGYQTDSIVYGLQVNLHLRSHSFDWLTLARANQLLAPLRNRSCTSGFL